MQQYQPLTDKQRKYLKWKPVEAIDGTVLSGPVPHRETRQSINKEMRQQRKRARSHRKRVEAAKPTARSEVVRPKWAKALLTAPFNKRSRKARR